MNITTILRINKKNPHKKHEYIFAEIEPFIYLCTVKEIMIVQLTKKSDEFSVKLIR